MSVAQKLTMVAGGAVVAVAVFLILLVAQHVWQDHQAVHLYDQILGYNLRVGRLVTPQQAPADTVQPPPTVDRQPPK